MGIANGKSQRIFGQLDESGRRPPTPRLTSSVVWEGLCLPAEAEETIVLSSVVHAGLEERGDRRPDDDPVLRRKSSRSTTIVVVDSARDSMEKQAPGNAADNHRRARAPGCTWLLKRVSHSLRGYATQMPPGSPVGGFAEDICPESPSLMWDPTTQFE